MIHDHTFYEMQSALAATGQLTDKESAELELHATSCASCRDCIEDMAKMSRMVFLVQAKRLNRRSTPEGMQQRFIERAAGAGIFIGSIPPMPLDLRLVRMAAIAVLLTIATSVSWKFFLIRDAERTIAPASAVAKVQPSLASRVISHAAEAQASYGSSRDKMRFRRKPTAKLAAVGQSSNQVRVTERPPYFAPKMLLFPTQGPPIGFSDGYAFWRHASLAGGHAVTRTPLTTAYFANCWEHGRGCRPEERAFHLDLKLASSALLTSTQSVNAQAYVTSLRFTAPAFHLDPTRAW